MPSYLSIDNIQTRGNLPYIFGDLADGTFPGTVITDNILDIDFSAMEMQYDISLNEVHYTVSPVEYVVDGNRYYVLGNARLAFSSDTASDTGEQFAIVVDADAYDSHASTISRKLYIGLLDADDSAEPIDAIALENSEEEGVDATVTRRSAPNTYIFEVGGETSINTTIEQNYGSEMIVHIDSVQTGSGTPSASNVRPIEGWTGTVISGTNINEQSSYAIDWADSVGTVYGGTLNVNTGLLTITHSCINSYNGETLTGRWISSMDAYSSGASPTIGSQVVYELESPTREYIPISDEGQYFGLQNPTANTGTVDITNYPDEVYAIGTSDAENPLIRRRALKITGTTGAVIIGNGTLLSLSDYPDYTPVDTGEDFAVLIPDVYATEDSSGEIPATVAISSSFASAMTSEFALQVTHYGMDRFHTVSADDYSDSETGETGSLYRILNEYGQAGPIPDIDDSKYDEALHGQNIIANTILAQQIDVRDLMAQDLSVTGQIHSSNKNSAMDNNEGFFLGYESVDGVKRATFGVGASNNAHIIYKGTSLDIKTNWLKFDEEYGVQIGQDADIAMRMTSGSVDVVSEGMVVGKIYQDSGTDELVVCENMTENEVRLGTNGASIQDARGLGVHALGNHATVDGGLCVMYQDGYSVSNAVEIQGVSSSNVLTVDWNGTTKSFGNFLSQQSDITIGTTPSLSQYLRAFGLMDSTGYLYADIQHTYLSDGYSGMTFCVNRDVNGTTKQNFFRILLGADGTNSIRFSDSEAWRKGLGVNIKTLSQNITTDQYGQCKVPSSLSGKTILSIRTGNYQYGAFLIGSTDIRVFKISETPLAWAASTSVPLIFVYID